MPEEAQAIQVRFRRGRIEIELADGRTVGTPLEFYPTLARATPAQRGAWEYFPDLTAIEWPRLDLQLSVESIVAGRREQLPPRGWHDRTAAALRKLGLPSRP